jgi:hypothetical protein
MDDQGFFDRRLGVGMKIETTNPPREFKVGRKGTITMKDCASVLLKEDEQVTFKTEAGAEYDVARKDWGFYATPSLNGRLKSFGWRSALTKNPSGRYFVMLVESGKEELFWKYMMDDQMTFVCWLDDEAQLQKVEAATKGER